VIHALLLRTDFRLLTLTGTGGVGKTRLLLEVAHTLRPEVADRVYFVPLAAINDPDFVLPAIAQVLGRRETDVRSGLVELQEAIGEQSLLLLLDNFEHLLAAAPELSQLLASCPRLRLLVTSRAALRLPGEHEFLVSPLALPDLAQLPERPEALEQYAACALFVQRAQAITLDFQLTTANTHAIAEVCIRLDGLPLAIELAAARTRLLSPQALLARFAHRLDILTRGTRTLPARQQTLRATISWSYDLLAPQEQRLFRWLAVFAGGCTLQAAEAMAQAAGLAESAVLDGVSVLLENHLLRQEEQPDGEPRLFMLETIRAYGLEVLGSGVEAQASHEAHAAYYLALAEQAEPQLSGPQQLSWFERLEREHDNLRAALSWFLQQGSDGQSKELALRFSGALSQFWEIRGYVSEGRQWLERILEISRRERSVVRAKALVGAGVLATLQDDFDQAEALCGEGLALYRELGDRQGSATALSSLGYAALMRGNYAVARAPLEEALALFREVGDAAGSIYALHRLASVLSSEGQYARAQALLEESLVLSREGGDVRGHALTLVLLGLALLSQGDLAQAHARLEESLTISREVGYKRNIGLSILYLGLVAFLQGDVARARSLLEESLAFFKEVSERGRIADVYGILGLISFSQGDYAAARARLQDSLKLSLKLNYKLNAAACLEGLAAVMAAQGEPVRAVWCMSAAEVVREVTGMPLLSWLQAMHEFTIASVRTQLGEQAFRHAWAEGRGMTPEQALATQEPLTEPLSPLSLSPAVPSSSPEAFGLTRRELDVLRQLSEGLSNAQIAERLVISPRTVDKHLVSIYGKLHVSSRTAAARFAHEQHLL
jgi:predicted ATPase/DNA-binding CsgD family transcriptional regulator